MKRQVMAIFVITVGPPWVIMTRRRRSPLSTHLRSLFH